MTNALKTFPLLAALAAVSACATAPKAPTATFPIGKFQQWRDDDAPYRLYPGDTVALRVVKAPELSTDLIVGPDGRVSPPLVGPVMVADRSLADAEGLVEAALATQLRDPDVDMRVAAYGSQKVFVGGEVANPGVFDLPGQIGPLEAVMMAGGFRDTAKSANVVLVRRAPNGQPMMKVVDVRAEIAAEAEGAPPALKRFDVVYVPRSTIAEVNLFMRQYVREALPVNFGFYYDLSNNN